MKSAKRSDNLSFGRVGDSTHGVEASQDPDDQAKRAERRESTQETTEKAEDKPHEAARGP